MNRRTVLPVVVLILLAGCGPGAGTPHVTNAHAGHAMAASAPRTGPSPTAAFTPAADPAGHSVYQLPGTWRDQSGAELELTDLAGRPRVVAFVYASCAYACPRIVARMKRIEAATGPEVGLVLVSIDPERDTPERLADFAASSRLDPARWTLLQGHPDRILELAVLLGVKYRATGDGDFAHANVLTLLDRDGVPVERVEGLETDVAPLLAALGG